MKITDKLLELLSEFYKMVVYRSEFCISERVIRGKNFWIHKAKYFVLLFWQILMSTLDYYRYSILNYLPSVY